MIKKTPMVKVKEAFGGKEKLITALSKSNLIERAEGEDKDVFQARLSGLSNTKLLKLHTLMEAAQKRFKNKEALVDTLLTLQNRAKDKDYRSKLMDYSVGRLYDRVVSSEKTAAKKSASK